MCNLNILCKVTDGSCTCEKPECPGLVRPVPVPSTSPQEAGLIISLFRMINQQNEMIKKISEDTRLTSQKIIKISQYLNLATPQIQNPSEESSTSVTIMETLCGSEKNFEFTLQLASELPEPAYKERAFSLLVNILNKNGEKVTLPSTAALTIMIFTTETPPKVLKINTSGDKIMRGTIDSEGTSSILFRKIVIKEVSSHFRNGCFFLVVAPKNNSSIQPLIIPNFVIKARKLNLDGTPRKKAKIGEENQTAEAV